MSVVTEALGALAKTHLSDATLSCDPDVRLMLTDLQHKFGDRLCAVLMYGSYLRGKRDTVLDFYVLLDEFADTLPGRWHSTANVLLPPNVYFLHIDRPATPPLQDNQVVAKYAVLTLSQFEQANRKDFHSYFWARFTQPSRLVYCRDEPVEEKVASAVAQAARTFISEVHPMMTNPFSSAELWEAGFELTYRCELRSEKADKLQTLYSNHSTYLDAVAKICLTKNPSGTFECLKNTSISAAKNRWRIRQTQGKCLSILRLIKAAGTFTDPLTYLLWKIHRHSGVYIEPTSRQKRYPLIFAWGLLWRLYRQGAFR